MTGQHLLSRRTGGILLSVAAAAIAVLPLLLVVAARTAFGGAIELVQPLVGRARELGDFAADLGGSTVGALIAWLLLRGR